MAPPGSSSEPLGGVPFGRRIVRFGLALAAAAALALAACGTAPDPAPPPAPLAAVEAPFVDVSDAAGFTRRHTGGGPDKAWIVEAKGGGSAVLDADGDGDMDIFWVNGATLDDAETGAGNALYRNDGGLRFRDIAAAAGVGGSGWGMGAVAADVDNDGDTDLYETCLRRNLLFRNDGAAFGETGAAAGVDVATWSTGAAFGDVDLDGDLDLYVAGYVEFDAQAIRPLGTLWKGVPAFIGPLGLRAVPDRLLRNDGDHFTDISRDAGTAAVEPGYGLGVLMLDADDDGDADIYVANDSSPNFLFRNDDGRFTDVALSAQVSHGAMGNAQAGMGVAAGDYDGDGARDLFVTNFDDDYNTLYRNEGDDTYQDVSFAVGLAQPGLPFVGFGAIFLDYDDDADLDLFVANGHVYPQIDSSGTNSSYAQVDHLFRNTGDGRFELVATDGRSPFPARVSRGALAADFDDDGDLDLFVTHLNDRPSLYRNDAAAGHWLGLRLLGVAANRDAVGARVVACSGGRHQVREVQRGSSFLGSEDPRLHFGLGDAAVVDSLIVHWPGGPVQRLFGVAADRYVTLRQP